LGGKGEDGVPVPKQEKIVALIKIGNALAQRSPDAAAAELVERGLGGFVRVVFRGGAEAIQGNGIRAEHEYGFSVGDGLGEFGPLLIECWHVLGYGGCPKCRFSKDIQFFCFRQ
jgi:hypothetical protein